MTEQEMMDYYQAKYRRTYQGVEGPITRDLIVQTARAQALLDFVRPKVASIDRCLDIGCSTGLILKHFQDQFGCKSVGIEPDDAYRAYARDQGLITYASLDELEKVPETRFDLVIMSHVLEHLPNPVGYLSHLTESLLLPESWLLLEVPNLYAHDSFEVAHLFAFTPHSLKEVLRKAGMGVDKYKKHGHPNSQILPLYLTVLCHPIMENEKIPVQPERYVALKRQIGILRRRFLEHMRPHQAWISLSDKS
jgi:SAM-dependent methyltransferase